MTRTKRPYTPEDVERDRAALARLNAPNHRAKILGLVAVGHPLQHVIQVGEHHQSWTEADVYRTLASIGVRPPAPPFGGGARPGPDARPVRLTEVQADVLREMCSGANVDTIARRMWITRGTAARHVTAVCEALEAEDRAQAISLVLTGKVRVAR